MSKSLAKDRVREGLREEILSGNYPSDTPLREVEIATQFGVSRTPVREALRELESEGFVRIVPNMGAFVGSLSWNDASEIFAIRIVLEAFAAQLTTTRLSDDQLQSLESLLEEQRRLAADGNIPGYAQSDVDFHALLNGTCGNRHLTQLIEMLNDKTKLSSLRNRTFQSKSGLETSLQEHQAILAALTARDARKVGDLLYRHGQRFYNEVVHAKLPDSSLQSEEERLLP